MSVFIQFIKNSKVAMAIIGAERTGYIVCLILTILLVGLHFAVAGSGHIWYDGDGGATLSNGVNYQNRSFNQYAAFIIIAASITFIISIILLVSLCTDRISNRVRHILATINLILEFALAIVISILASVSSNERNMYSQIWNREYDDLNLYYRLCVADAVITFVLQIVYLAVIYFGTLRQIEQGGIILHPTLPEPPITADRLN